MTTPTRNPLVTPAQEFLAPRPTAPTEKSPSKLKLPLIDFVSQAWQNVEPQTPFVHNWHFTILCEHLEALHDGDIPRLIANMPPGHGASTIVQVLWPAWVWLHDAQWKVLFASVNKHQAAYFGKLFQMLVESEWYTALQGGAWLPTPGRTEAGFYQNQQGGIRMGVGVLGAMTGYRFSAIVADSPEASLTTPEQAAELRRWYAAFQRRLNDPRNGSQLLITPGFGENDLTNWLLSEPGNFEHLSLPAEWYGQASVTSICLCDLRARRAKVGEPLWPDLFPLSVLQQAQRDLGDNAYKWQFQQGGRLLREGQESPEEPTAKGRTTLMPEKFTAADAANLADETIKELDKSLESRIAPTIEKVIEAVKAAATATPPRFQASVACDLPESEQQAALRDLSQRGFHAFFSGSKLIVSWKPPATARMAEPSQDKVRLLES